MRKSLFGGAVYAVLTALVLAAARVQGATYYVSTSGSDSNPGTSAQPFRTISYAYSKASAGTTILVAPGTYTDYQSGWGLHLGKSGTSGSPITIQSQVRGGAIIDGQNASDRNEAIYIDGSYNVVSGFAIRNGPNGGISLWGNGNQILDNEIDHNGNPASTSTNGHDGVYDNENTSGNEYVGNFIHDNGRAGGSNLDHGLYLCGNNTLVLNNVVIRNDSRGLQIAGYTTVNNMKVYNNVFAWNGVDGVTVWMDMSGVDIKNNICYQNGRYGIQFSAATGSGVAMDHNLVYANVSGNYYFDTGSSTVSYTLGTTLSSDPKFVNSTSANFDAHLQSASPAIGAGLNFSSVFTTDMESAARPASGAWDLGAYVHAAPVALPTVTVAASTPAASRVGLASGSFLVSRTGDSSSALTVNLALSGTATNGVDYTSLGTTLTIPAGAASATLVVAPLPSASVVGSRTVVVTLSSNSLYSVGSSFKSTVTIAGNSLPCAIHPTSGNSIQLSWNSVTGKIYRVAYKNSLTDSAWTDLGGAITATGASASYSDANVRVRAQRFYVVRVTN